MPSCVSSAWSVTLHLLFCTFARGQPSERRATCQSGGQLGMPIQCLRTQCKCVYVAPLSLFLPQSLPLSPPPSLSPCCFSTPRSLAAMAAVAPNAVTASWSFYGLSRQYRASHVYRHAPHAFSVNAWAYGIPGMMVGIRRLRQCSVRLSVLKRNGELYKWHHHVYRA